MLETCFMKRCGGGPAGGSIPRATGARAIAEGRFPRCRWAHILFFFNLEPAMVVRPGLGEEVAGCCGVRRKPSVQYDKQRHVKNIKVFASSMETIFTIMYQNDQYHILHPSQLLIVLIFLDTYFVLCISTERE